MASILSSTGSGIDRKSLKRPDSFVTSVTGFFGQVTQHTGTLILVGAGVIGMGVGVGMYFNHREAQSDAARNALYSAEKSFEGEMKKLAPAPSTPKKDAKGKDMTAEQAQANALDKLTYQK